MKAQSFSYIRANRRVRSSGEADMISMEQIDSVSVTFFLFQITANLR